MTPILAVILLAAAIGGGSLARRRVLRVDFEPGPLRIAVDFALGVGLMGYVALAALIGAGIALVLWQPWLMALSLLIWIAVTAIIASRRLRSTSRRWSASS